MQTLFSPAVALMNRLSFSKKFVVLGFLSLLAVIVVFYSLYQNLNRVILDSERELQGLIQIKRITQAMQFVQQHRGLSVAVLGGIESLRDKRDSSEPKVDSALSALGQTLSADSLTSAAYADIKNDWEQLRQNAANYNAQESYRLHSRLVEKLLDLEKIIGEESLLFTDSNQDSYRLIMLITEQMPRAFESIGRLRAYGIGILAKKQISDQEKIEIYIIKDRIEAGIEMIEETTRDFQRYKPELHPILANTRENIVNASSLITQYVIADILQEKFSINPEYFFSTVTLALDTAYAEIYDSFIPTAEQLIEARMKAARTTLALSIGIPGCLFLLIIYFAIGAHLAVRGSVERLAKTAKAFSGGDFQQRMPLTLSDEIGQVAESFNEMADGFAALLTARRDDEIRIRSIIDTALDALVQMDAEGVINGWNRQAEQIFGWSAGEVLGRLLHDVIIPERYRQAHRHGMQRYLDTGRGSVLNQRIEVVALHRDGHEFPIELAITPNKLDNVIEFSAFIRDISAQKRAILTLQASEQRHRALFESSRDALMTLSASRGFISGNTAAINLFGCRDEQEFLAQTPASLSPEYQPDGRSSAELVSEKFEQVIADGSITFEWLHKRLNGETFYAEVQLSQVEIDNEMVVRATVRDISEKKRAKAALVASEARTRAVLRTMSDAVVMIDSKGIMLLVNDAITDLFGYEEDELLGQNVKMLMPEPYYSEHDGYLSRHLESKERVIIGRRVDVEGKRKDGLLVPIELSVNELMDDFGTTYIGIMRDISHRKAVEQAHETARLEAERLVHMKSEFLANMSHEIRTPLNAIIGLAKISVRDNQGRNMGENSVRIYDAGMHLLSLVNDILDFSKIEAGKMTLDEHPFRLDALIDDAISLVDMRAKEKQLDLIVHRAPDLPEWVNGDPLRLRQILVNLLSNAVKFTEHGYVSLDVSRQKDLTEISVTDSGIGMTAEQMSRLFTAFEQADSSTTRKFGGSGLGLAISRDLANLMGGDIVVKSSLGSGSKFTLSVPLPATDAGIEHSAEYQQGGGGRLRGFRILAAEDVALNRLVLEDLLIHEGAHVTFAENGKQALDRLEEAGYANFDAVLMDIQMPVMDGYQAARRILEIAPTLPIIGLTAHAMPEERQRCLETGMRERVTKPIDVNALVGALRQHVAISKAAAENRRTDAAAVAIENQETEQEAAAVSEVDGVIDWAALHQRFDGRQAFIDKLIDNALDGTQQGNLDKLRQAAEQRDYAGIKFVAHNLKGFAGIFEVQPLLSLAQQAEVAAKNQAEHAIALAEDLAKLLETILAELQSKRTATHSA